MERNRRLIIETPELAAIGINFLGMYRYLRPDAGLEPHEHGGATEICYLEKGNQSYTVGGKSYEVTGGEVFVTFPHEVHSTGEAIQSRGCLYWIQLNSDCGELFGLAPSDAELIGGCIKSLNLRRFRVSSNTGGLLISAFNDIASGSGLRLITARSKLVLFICGLVSDMANYGREGGLSPEISACLVLIDENIRGELTSAYLADKLNFSESYFKLKFKREVGVPPREYILLRKIELSKAELESGAKNITDIALEYGFSSSQHYSRVFRDVTGMSPSEFIHG